MQPMYQGIPFSPNTELTQDITATATTIYVSNIAYLPDAPNYAVIGSEYPTIEVVTYTGKSNNAITGCKRAVEGTAKAWTAGTLIARNYTNKDHENFIKNIEELESKSINNLSDGEGTCSICTKYLSAGVEKTNIASGYCSYAGGWENTASGDFSYAEGQLNIASSYHAHTEGCKNIASSPYTHAQGYGTKASSNAAHAQNYYTIANVSYSTAIGKYNKEMLTNNLFVIGNGSSEDARSNIFRVSSSAIYGTGAYNTSGADYSEFFEWLDQNPNNDDRVGLFVTLDGNKIKIANSNDNYILGVVSATPSVIGNSYNDQWQGMYLKDKFGRIIFEDVKVPDLYKTIGDKEVLIEKAHNERRPKLNPDFDVKQKFIGRENRKEWDAIGMLGVLPVYDDGSCQVNSYCKVADNGIATSSETGYRVLERIDKNIIKILFR